MTSVIYSYVRQCVSGSDSNGTASIAAGAATTTASVAGVDVGAQCTTIGLVAGAASGAVQNCIRSRVGAIASHADSHIVGGAGALTIGSFVQVANIIDGHH